VLPPHANSRGGLSRSFSGRHRTRDDGRRPARTAAGGGREARSIDFQGTNLYCVTLSAGDLRRLGYRGHAFFCENSTTGEVLGAVLGSHGGVRCLISGSRTDTACYSFDICGYSDGVCLQ